MKELLAIIDSSRTQRIEEQKFMAAVQGATIDGEDPNKPPQEFLDLQAKVASRGMAADSNDILSMQGNLASQAGFGIGMGLDFEVAGADFSWDKI